MIRFYDVKLANKDSSADVQKAIKRVMKSGQYVLGAEVEKFELELARYCDAEFAIGVANGLDALTMALIAHGIGPGDEVITAGATFVATWLAIANTGATVVPIEPETVNWNIDPSRIEEAITKKTAAIVPVHLYGRICDMERITAIAAAKGLPVISDAAQAIGASRNNKKVGQVSQTSILSFYPGKNLGALGDAGAILTNDREIASKVRVLRNYGSEQKYKHILKGFNSRMDEFQAAILLARLPYLSEINGTRKKQAQRYIEGINHSTLTLPKIVPFETSSWHIFNVHVSNRFLLQKHLQMHKIETGIHYPIAPHKQLAFEDYSSSHLPLTESWADNSLSLPIGPHLKSRDIDRVISSINEFTENQQS